MKKIFCILALSAAIAAPGVSAAPVLETHDFPGLGLAVPDGNPSGLANAQSISSVITNITTVTVDLNISGTWNGDLYAYLTHGSGIAVLLNRSGKTAADAMGYGDDGFAVTLDDTSPNNIHTYQGVTIPSAASPLTGTWQPDGRNIDPDLVVDTDPSTALLSSFNGEEANGGWTLFVADLSGGEAHVLESWSLHLTGEADTTPPVIACPSDAIIECDGDTSATTAGAGVATATDNGSAISDIVISSSDSVSNGTCQAEQTITRTWTATDEAGNMATCDQTITVVDTTAPSITCPADVTLECDADVTPLVASPLLSQLPSLNQGGSDIAFGIVAQPFTLSSLQQLSDVRLWLDDTVANDNGQLDSFSGALSIAIYSDGAGLPDTLLAVNNFTGLTTTDAGFDNALGNDVGFVDVALSGFAPLAAGTYWLVLHENAWLSPSDNSGVYWHVSNPYPGGAGNSNATNPSAGTWNGPGPGYSLVLNVASGNAAVGLPTVSDNCDLNPSLSFSDAVVAGTCLQESTITRTWTVTDACGNSNSCDQVITVVDTTAPVIACPANITIECDEPQGPFNTGFATATDNCGASPVTMSYSDVVTPGDCPQESIITRTWIATDVCSNTNDCVQIITVVDTTAPVLVGLPNNSAITRQCDNVPNPPNVTAIDNCDPNPGLVYEEVRTDGNCINNYTLVRTWTATDACDNESSFTQTITVQDTTSPMAICQDITVFLDNTPNGGGTVTITPADIDNGSSDNCSAQTNLTLALSKTTFTCQDLNLANGGTNMVTLTVTDECGNSTTCDANVIVLDPHAPTARCKDIEIVILKSAGGVYVLDPLEVDDGSDDNCSIVNYSVSPDTFTCAAHVDTVQTVTLTVTDQSGNSSNCTAQVTVRSEAYITSRPKDIIGHEYKTAEFCIDWCGSTNGLTFQWFKDNVAIAGETNDCITFDCLHRDDEAIYAMEVYNFYGPTPTCRTEDLQLFVTFGEIEPLYDLAVTNTDLVVHGAAEDDGIFGVFTASGDVNGDCVDDLLVAWPKADGAPGRTDSGTVAVYFGAPHSQGIRDLNGIAGAEPDIRILGADVGDQLRYNSAMRVADLTGDGIGEIIVGAWLGRGPGNTRYEAGEVAILFGRDNWAPNTVIDLATLTTTDGIMVYAAAASDHLTEGGALATGDLNNDGREDLVLGAPLRSKGYVLFGRPINAWRTGGDLDLATDADVVINAKVATAVSSRAPVWTTGDLNGDGLAEIVMGTRVRVSAGGPGVYTYDGAVYVIRGRAQNAYPATMDVTTGDAEMVVTGLESGIDLLHTGALKLDDLNGDGSDELLLGAPRSGGPGNARPEAGALWVFNGRPAGSWPATLALGVDPIDLHVLGADAEDRIGQARSLASGDMDGDGLADLALGIADADGPGNARPGTGEAIVLSGTALSGDLDLATPSSYALRVMGGNTADNLTRSGSIGLADLDCDGRADLILGTHEGDGLDFSGFATDGRENAGEVLVLYGRTTWPKGIVDLDSSTNNADVVVIGSAPGDSLTHFGQLHVGDLNGDHVPDLYFAAPLSQGPEGLRPDSGQARVLYGHAPGPSLVITNLIADLTSILIGADGFAAGYPSSLWLEYGLTPSLELGMVPGSLASLTGYDHTAFVNLLSGLDPNRTYYLQTVITNECGTFRGELVSTNTLNNAPVAMDDTFESPTNTVFTIDPLTNDDYPLDADGDTVTLVAMTNIIGDITLAFLDPLFEVTPGTSFTGNASFDYWLSDGVTSVMAHVVMQDTIAPQVAPAGPITVEATSPAGAAVTYSLSASDAVDPNPSLVSSPASGSTFPLGTSSISVTATDLAGNVNSTPITVDVVDTTPPVLNLPADITVPDDGLPGSMVTFVVGANDLVDPSPSVVATPASGSTFAPGTTTVNVTAMDASGNTSMGSFTVTVASGIVITMDPLSTTAFETGSTSFSVMATGPGTLTYQWFKDGAPIPGATSSTLGLDCITSGDAGSYSVVVSNGGSMVPSAVAVLTVNPAPPAGDVITDLASNAWLTVYAQAANDSGYGQPMAVGDVNDDGIDDLVMALPRADPLGRTDAGMVGIYFGGGIAPVLDFAGLAAPTPDVLILGARAGDYLGRDTGLVVADLDGDGIVDLAIGVPFGDGPGNSRTSSGEAVILFGRAAWPAVLDLDVPADVDVTIHGSGSADGLTLAGAMTSGDFNGDGLADLALGAPGADGISNGRSTCGEAHVLLGRLPAQWASTPVIDLATPGAIAMQVIGAGTQDKLTFSGTLLSGDLDGDGFDELILAAGLADGPANARTSAGEVYVIRGQSVLPAIADLSSGGAASIVYGADAYDKIGSGKNIVVGDVNADGLGDLLIGSDQADGPGNTRSLAGEAYLILGSTSLTPIIDLASGGATTTIFAPRAGDAMTLGAALDLGDVNGDGLDDILLGASKADGPGDVRINGGDAYLLWGRVSWPATIDLDTTVDHTVHGASLNDTLGGPGGALLDDVNGDGLADLILVAIGGDGANNTRGACGEVVVLYGQVAFTTNVTDLALSNSFDRVIFGARGSDLLGNKGALTTGDFNGDGIRDLALGASQADGPANGRSNSGSFYIVPGQIGSGSCLASMDVFSPSLSLIAGADSGEEAPRARPLVLQSPSIDDLGNLSVYFEAVAGQQYTLEASTDLNVWLPLGQIVAPNSGVLSLDDFEAVYHQKCFYRLITQE